jgi:hypothetical protein
MPPSVRGCVDDPWEQIRPSGVTSTLVRARDDARAACFYCSVMRRLGPMLGALVVFSAGCGHGTPAADATSHSTATVQSPHGGEQEVRREAQVFWDEILTGQGNAAFQMLSQRCQTIDPYFLGQVEDLANRHTGGPERFLTFTAHIHGDRARATYTFPNSALNQHGDRWVFEDSGWRWDACDRPLGAKSKAKSRT